MAKGSKLSKMAANRLAVTATVTSSATVHGAEIAGALHQLLFPEGPHRSEATHKFLGGLGSYLDRAAAEVQAADLAHAAEMMDDEEPRLRRDEAQAILSSVLLEQRKVLESLYGAKVSGFYGLAAALPTQPAALLQRARTVAQQLRNQPITAKPLRPGLTAKGKDLASELDGRIAALEAALGDVKREEREGQLTLQRKNQAAAAWQAAYQGVTYAFYGLYLLAGRPDLAERIEPTARRRAGLPEPEDGGDGPSPGPAAPGTPADPAASAVPTPA